MTVPPAFVLALLTGLFHTGLYVLLRGRSGGRLPLVYLAAALGAWAGAAVGARLGIGLLAIGDFGLVAASVVAWLGIGFVAVISVLGPQSERVP
jgi:hypothetical protein